MDARRLLKRVESQRDSEAVLRSVGRDLGHDLASKNVAGLGDVVAGLALSGGQPLAPWTAGYRAALGDLLAAFAAELGESEREVELDRLTRERANWAPVLRELAKEPRTPTELAEGLKIDGGQMSRLLGELRLAGLAQVRVLERGDSRTKPHELTLVGERVVGRLGVGQPDERQIAAFRAASSVLGRVFCEGVLEPSALAQTVRIALGEKPSVDPRLAAMAVLKEAVRVGVVNETSEGLVRSEYAVASVVNSLLEEKKREGFWESLTKGFDRDVSFLVRATSETHGAWQHFFVRSNIGGRGQVLDPGDIDVGIEQPKQRVVLLYDSASLHAQDVADHPERMQAIESVASFKRCIATKQGNVPKGYEPFYVELQGSVSQVA